MLPGMRSIGDNRLVILARGSLALDLHGLHMINGENGIDIVPPHSRLRSALGIVQTSSDGRKVQVAPDRMPLRQIAALLLHFHDERVVQAVS